MTDDRPVSLAAVEELIRAREFAFASDDGFRRALSDVRALPTFAPATPAAPKSVDEMAAEMGLTVADLVRLHAEHTAPTKLPREMPAPKVGMVAAFGGDIEIVVIDNSCTAWNAVRAQRLPALTYLDVTRIYWPGPTPVVIWERA